MPIPAHGKCFKQEIDESSGLDRKPGIALVMCIEPPRSVLVSFGWSVAKQSFHSANSVRESNHTHCIVALCVQTHISSLTLAKYCVLCKQAMSKAIA